jgi:hypothetical protein
MNFLSIPSNNGFDGVVGYHVSLTSVRTLKVSSSSLGRIIFFLPESLLGICVLMTVACWR